MNQPRLDHAEGSFLTECSGAARPHAALWGAVTKQQTMARQPSGGGMPAGWLNLLVETQ